VFCFNLSYFSFGFVRVLAREVVALHVFYDGAKTLSVSLCELAVPSLTGNELFLFCFVFEGLYIGLN